MRTLPLPASSSFRRRPALRADFRGHQTKRDRLVSLWRSRVEPLTGYGDPARTGRLWTRLVRILDRRYPV